MILSAAGALLLAGAVAGCGSLYRPALYDTNLPAAVPLHGDARGTYYGLEGGSSPGFNEGERLSMGRGHYMIADNQGPVRISYGAYFYGGNYRIQEELNAKLQGPRSFGGAGAQADLAFVESFGNISVGGGVYGALGLELGPYPLLWKRRGMLPYVALADIYATFGTRLGDGDRWLGFQFGLGLPGLLSINGQLDLGEVLIWGGAGTALDRFPAPGTMRRFTAGITYRAE